MKAGSTELNIYEQVGEIKKKLKKKEKNRVG